MAQCPQARASLLLHVNVYRASPLASLHFRAPVQLLTQAWFDSWGTCKHRTLRCFYVLLFHFCPERLVCVQRSSDLTRCSLSRVCVLVQVHPPHSHCARGISTPSCCRGGFLQPRRGFLPVTIPFPLTSQVPPAWGSCHGSDFEVVAAHPKAGVCISSHPLPAPGRDIPLPLYGPLCFHQVLAPRSLSPYHLSPL